MHARAVVFVEGTSDRIALETLAARRGRDLAAEGVAVVAIGGAQGIGNVLARVGQEGVRIGGLCDAGEEGHFRRALEREGFGPLLTRTEMERLKDVNVSLGLMLESVSPRLRGRGEVHQWAPDKEPSVRLRTIRAAGELRIPFTTGILLGIGETRR